MALRRSYRCQRAGLIIIPLSIHTDDILPAAEDRKKKLNQMNKSTRLLVTAAAMAGLYSGALVSRTFASINAGTQAEDGSKDKDKAKHDCKGKNACKGQGGCGTSDNGCKGKNSCKGKGGCSTADKPADKK